MCKLHYSHIEDSMNAFYTCIGIQSTRCKIDVIFFFYSQPWRCRNYSAMQDSTSTLHVKTRPQGIGVSAVRASNGTVKSA